MSRGPGRLQRALWQAIQQHGKPMAFAEIRAEVVEAGIWVSPSLERSLRRALYRMVSDGELIALGSGGRADPHRYFIHPMIIGMMGKTPEADALFKALKADPGAARWLIADAGRPQAGGDPSMVGQRMDDGADRRGARR